MLKMKKKLLISFGLVLFIMVFLSACGEEEEPTTDDSWLSELNKLAVETAIENSFDVEILIKEVNVELVIDQIYCGSFSQENANEIFLECRLLDMPTYAGFDTRVGILLDADTLEMIAYKEFAGDEVELKCLQAANGQSRILSLCTFAGQGHRAQYINLYAVSGSEWEELPTGIEEFIPEEKKRSWGTEDCFCYMAGGDRLVVTYEEDEQVMFETGREVSSELIAILVWDPHKEQFVLVTPHTALPTIQPN